MGIPLAPPGKTLETIRRTARRRFFLAALFLMIGSCLLAAAHAFLLALVYVGGLTGLILGALLQILGLLSAAMGAVGLGRAFPLSEPATTARRALLAALLVLFPAGFLATAAWLALAMRQTTLLLLPALPSAWAPMSATAAFGLVFAARALASERMAVLAAVGFGGVLATAVAALAASLGNPLANLEDPRLAGDLLLVGLGFAAIAIAFERDAWAARSGPRP